VSNSAFHDMVKRGVPLGHSIVYPDLEHEYRPDFTHHAKAWMDRYLR